MRYRDDIVDPIIRPFAGAIGDDFLLMHKNARPHVARVVQDYMEEAEIEVMDWPAVSPDLNPIEHCWDCVRIRIRDREPPPQTLPELSQELMHRRMGDHVSTYGFEN